MPSSLVGSVPFDVASLPVSSLLVVPAPVVVFSTALDFVDRRLAHLPPPLSYVSSASYAYLAVSFDTRIKNEFLIEETLLRPSSLSFAVASSSPMPSSSRIPVSCTRC